ncbi:hypothetical protein HPG92_10630 [Salmonella enterica]|nr:hypothetical protein HPG92_10630 [Salmonella enterica]
MQSARQLQCEYAINRHQSDTGCLPQGGRLFARGLKDKGIIKVIWGQYSSDNCTFSYQSVVKRQTDKPAVTILPVRCMRPQKQ